MPLPDQRCPQSSWHRSSQIMGRKLETSNAPHLCRLPAVAGRPGVGIPDNCSRRSQQRPQRSRRAGPQPLQQRARTLWSAVHAVFCRSEAARPTAADWVSPERIPPQRLYASRRPVPDVEATIVH